MTIPITANEDPRWTAFRWWRVYRDALKRPHLTGWFYDVPWALDGWTEAIHRLLGEKAPHEGPCPSTNYSMTHYACGLYAWATLAKAHGTWENVPRYELGFTRIDDGPYPVLGVVKVAGHLMHHGSEGVRAQYARPVAFALPEGSKSNPILAEINERLGLPILSVPEFGVHAEIPESLERYAYEFGEPLFTRHANPTEAA